MAVDEGPFMRIKDLGTVEVFYVSKIDIEGRVQKQIGDDCGDKDIAPDDAFKLNTYTEKIEYKMTTESDFFSPSVSRVRYSEKDEEGDFNKVETLSQTDVLGQQYLGSVFSRKYSGNTVNAFISYTEEKVLWGENVVTSDVREKSDLGTDDNGLSKGFWAKMTPEVGERNLSSETFRNDEIGSTLCEKIKESRNDFLDLNVAGVRFEYEEFPESYFIVQGFGVASGFFVLTVIMKRFHKETGERIE